MEIYSTEEQQEEAIKKAIKENWLVVLIGAAIGLGAVWGWRYYDASMLAQQEADSAAYTQVIESIGKEGSDVVAMADDYIANHDNKSYTVMAAMVAAKQAVEKNNLEEAQKQLQWAYDNSDNDTFKAVNGLRLARVKAELGKSDEALALLNNPMPEAFTAQLEELKGDVYVKLGNNDKARVAYQLAADNDGLTGNNGLQYKLDSLAQATP